MFDILLDPLTNRHILLADGRAGRPNEFAGDDADCPFCAGSEQQTPPALLTIADGQTHDHDVANWSVRVVPNKYPAILADEATGAAHEVIIESPRHVASFSELAVDEVADGLRAYRQRMWFHRDRGRAKYVQIFKNVGPASGATLSHTHSQLLALPFVPADVENELSTSAAYFRQKQRCLFCHMVAEEQAQQTRIVAQAAGLIAFCPAASRFPLQIRLMPVAHDSAFEEIRDEDVKSLAALLRELIDRIERAAGRPAHNLILRSSPFDRGAVEHYHWHIELIPRVTNIGGFELGTGCFINPVSPEEATERMRGL